MTEKSYMYQSYEQKVQIQLTCNLDNIGVLLRELSENCKPAWKSGKLIIADGMSNP